MIEQLLARCLAQVLRMNSRRFQPRAVIRHRLGKARGIAAPVGRRHGRIGRQRIGWFRLTNDLNRPRPFAAQRFRRHNEGRIEMRRYPVEGGLIKGLTTHLRIEGRAAFFELRAEGREALREVAAGGGTSGGAQRLIETEGFPEIHEAFIVGRAQVSLDGGSPLHFRLQPHHAGSDLTP